jgi:hypothetical protein
VPRDSAARQSSDGAGGAALRSCRAEAEDDARDDGGEADGADDDEEEGEEGDDGDDDNAGNTMHLSGGGMCQARDNADRARNRRVATAAVLAIAPQSLESETCLACRCCVLRLQDCAGVTVVGRKQLFVTRAVDCSGRSLASCYGLLTTGGCEQVRICN